MRMFWIWEWEEEKWNGNNQSRASKLAPKLNDNRSVTGQKSQTEKWEKSSGGFKRDLKSSMKLENDREGERDSKGDYEMLEALFYCSIVVFNRWTNNSLIGSLCLRRWLFRKRSLNELKECFEIIVLLVEEFTLSLNGLYGCHCQSTDTFESFIWSIQSNWFKSILNFLSISAVQLHADFGQRIVNNF